MYFLARANSDNQKSLIRVHRIWNERGHLWYDRRKNIMDARGLNHRLGIAPKIGALWILFWFSVRFLGNAINEHTALRVRKRRYLFCYLLCRLIARKLTFVIESDVLRSLVRTEGLHIFKSDVADWKSH